MSALFMEEKQISKITLLVSNHDFETIEAIEEYACSGCSGSCGECDNTCYGRCVGYLD